MDIKSVPQSQTNSTTQDLLCSLPTDILNNIFHFINRDSNRTKIWFSLRLVNRKFYHWATDQLIFVILASCNDELNRLEKEVVTVWDNQNLSVSQGKLYTQIADRLVKYRQCVQLVQYRVSQQQLLRKTIAEKDSLPLEVRQQMIALIPLTSELLTLTMLLNAIRGEQTHLQTSQQRHEPLVVFPPRPLNPILPNPLYPRPPGWGEPTPDHERPPGWNPDFERDLDPLGMYGAPWPFGNSPNPTPYTPFGRGRGPYTPQPPNPNTPPNPFNPNPPRPDGPRWI